MMIANRFRAVGWVAGVAAAALSCYLISLRVAAERGQLMKLERRILTARSDIRQLRTELDTRGRLVQLERWNADVLGLKAPEASQYAHGEVQLAGYMQPKPAPQVIQVAVQAPTITPTPQVVVASYQAQPTTVRPERSRGASPSEVEALAASRFARTATSTQPVVGFGKAEARGLGANGVGGVSQSQPLVRHAAYTPAPTTKPAIVAVAVAARKPAPPSKSALLGDDLLGEIGTRAAVEAKK